MAILKEFRAMAQECGDRGRRPHHPQQPPAYEYEKHRTSTVSEAEG